MANIAAKLDRLSIHRRESSEPHHFDLLHRWHSGEWVLRKILLGRLNETRHTTAEPGPLVSCQSPKIDVEE